MKVLLTGLQYFLGIFFLYFGVNHFLIPEGLPASMAWMYDLAPMLHWFSGTAEILAGLGLILPGLIKFQTRLIPWAAAGLVPLMLGAIVWHAQRSEISNIVQNIILAGLAAFVAYGRWKLFPLKDKTR